MRKWEVIDSSYIFKNPFGNLRKDKCLLPNGLIIEEYYVNEYPDWVNVVAITRDRQVIFISQYRHGCQDFVLEIPGGAKKVNEDESTAILRELAEETGFTSLQKPILLANLHSNPAIATNQVQTFLVLDVYKVSEQNLDDTEEIEVKLIPLDQVAEKIHSGQITQIFSVAAYYMAAEYLKKHHIF